jgi:hypothetical protein
MIVLENCVNNCYCELAWLVHTPLGYVWFTSEPEPSGSIPFFGCLLRERAERSGAAPVGVFSANIRLICGMARLSENYRTRALALAPSPFRLSLSPCLRAPTPRRSSPMPTPSTPAPAPSTRTSSRESSCRRSCAPPSSLPSPTGRAATTSRHRCHPPSRHGCRLRAQI